MMNPIEVLLVEDNPADADLTQEALSESKLLVNLQVVDDGEKAESLLLHRPPFENAIRPHLILLDLNLPRRNGREVLKTIRGTPSLRHIPVVVLSSSNAEIDVLKTYNLGANCYVVKPVRLTDFFDIVRLVGEFWFTVVRLPPPEFQPGKELTPLPVPPAPVSSPATMPLNVLLVEDNVADVDLVREYLEVRPAWKLHACRRLDEAFATIERQQVDVVLLDLGLPDSQGLETLTQVTERLPRTPVIVLTGRDEPGLGVLAVRSGAQDFLEKDDLGGDRLARAITYAAERSWLGRERDALLARANAARERAEEAVLMRDEFLSVASHELRTPLTSLRLQQYTMQRALERPEQGLDMPRLRRAVTSMARQCEQLSHLVDTLLDVSRLTTGRMTLERTEVDLVQVVRDCVERLAPQVESSGSPLRLELGPPVVGFWDRFRIEQVVVNLLTNALKYGEKRPVEIRIRTDKEKAILQVRDHGIGIRDEDQKRIFDRFERAVSTKHFGGVGLGLYITRQIVNAHTGTLSLESQPGQGSLFTVCLPLSRTPS
jgi:signal transduction histidine kinase